MKIKNLFVFALVGCFGCADVYAKDYGAELISSCAAIQLKSCQMIKRTVKSEQLSEYSKAFNCLKKGSTSGDKFDLGIPLPDLGGMLGVGLDSTASYSTEVCKEEIKKLDSAGFLKEYSETFDKECGRTLSGQYQQCVVAASQIKDSSQIQNFQCSAVQSASQIVINTKYVPGAGEGPEDYKIKSIRGVEGISCEENAHAGVNQYSSLSCSLPEDYNVANVVLKLNNGVSCSVPVLPERKFEIEMAKKFTCSNIYNSISDSDLSSMLKVSPLFTATMVGLCDICLAENINTPDYDQRTLSKRAAGCAVWAMVSVAKASAQVCSIKASTNTGAVLGGYGGFPTATNGASPQILPTAQGTERDKHISFGFGPESSPGSNSDWSQSLCNGRKEGEIIQLHGQQWNEIPIDYLSTKDAKEPAMKEFINILEESLK